MIFIGKTKDAAKFKRKQYNSLLGSRNDSQELEFLDTFQRDYSQPCIVRDGTGLSQDEGL